MAIPQLLQAGVQIIISLVNGLTDAIPNLVIALVQVVNQIYWSIG